MRLLYLYCWLSNKGGRQNKLYFLGNMSFMEGGRSAFFFFLQRSFLTPSLTDFLGHFSVRLRTAAVTEADEELRDAVANGARRGVERRLHSEHLVKVWKVVLAAQNRFKGRLCAPVYDIIPFDGGEEAMALDALGVLGTEPQTVLNLQSTVRFRHHDTTRRPCWASLTRD